MLKERKYLCTKILTSCIKECRSVIELQRNGSYNTYENNAVKLTFNIEPHIVPYLEVVIDEKLPFTIIVFGWLCPGLPLEPKAMQGDKVLSTCYILSY